MSTLKPRTRVATIIWNKRCFRYFHPEGDFLTVRFRRGEVFEVCCALAIAQDLATSNIATPQWRGADPALFHALAQRLGWSITSYGTFRSYWSYMKKGRSTNRHVTDLYLGARLVHDRSVNADDLFGKGACGFHFGPAIRKGSSGAKQWSLEFEVSEEGQEDFDALRATVGDALSSLDSSYWHELFRPILDDYACIGGRQGELEQLIHFVQSGAGGVCLVTGRSGTGKTALMVQLLDRLEDVDVDVVVHFINRRMDPSRPFFLHNTCQQLAWIHEEEFDPDTKEWDLKVRLRKLLALPAGKGRRIVVVIDGLDESLPTWGLGKSFLPRSGIPKDVCLIVSAREMANKNWVSDLGLQAADTPVINLDRMSAGDIEDVVMRHKLVTEEVVADATQQLKKITEGDPFYLHDLLQKLRGKGGNLAVLKAYPIGTNAYLKQWWKDGCAACHDSGVGGAGSFGDLMACLAVSHGPVPRELLSVLGQTESLRGAGYLTLIDAARRYVVGNDTGGYQLSHGRIREFVGAQMKRYLRKYRSDFADACFDWRDLAEVPALDYALRYGPQHLRDAKREDEIGKLLFDFEWLRAKLEAAGVSALLADFELISGSDERQVQEAIRLSAHAIVKDPGQLGGQLAARLPRDGAAELARIRDDASAIVRGPRLWPIHVRLSAPGGALLQTLDGHKRAVWMVAVDESKGRIVSASSDGTLRIWDCHHGTEVSRTEGIYQYENFLTVLPGGGMVLTVLHEHRNEIVPSVVEG